MTRLRVGVIYRVTYPNGKIYIGQDRTDDVNYFGSADSDTIAADFTAAERDAFAVRKDILLRRRGITIQRLNAYERAFIADFRANDPGIGYNRTGRARRRCHAAVVTTTRRRGRA